MTTAAKPRPLTCERCGAAFECGSTAGHCWCFEADYKMRLPPAGSKADCLCPACLRAAAEAAGRLSATTR